MAKKTLEQVDTAITRWQSRLRRAVNAIERLQKARKRMVKMASVNPTKRLAETIIREIVAEPPPKPLPAEIDTAIPAFLQRKKLDPAAEQIMQEQQETKRRKASGRIAKMKAKRSGETKKMPLTGKAALQAIRHG